MTRQRGSTNRIAYCVILPPHRARWQWSTRTLLNAPVRIWALCDWYDSSPISRLVASYMASINVSDKIWLITCENKQILIIHAIIYILTYLRYQRCLNTSEVSYKFEDV